MTDPGIAAALNRQIAREFALRLDSVDRKMYYETPWYRSDIADTLMHGQATDCAWLVGGLLASGQNGIRGIDFSSYPADGDWELLFADIRAEILARRTRDSETPGPEAVPAVTGGQV